LPPLQVQWFVVALQPVPGATDEQSEATAQQLLSGTSVTFLMTSKLHELWMQNGPVWQTASAVPGQVVEQQPGPAAGV
jgi:hypothetical protein